MRHHMQLRILHLLPDGRANDIDFRFRVSQFAGEKSEFVRFESLHYLEVIPGTNLFLLGKEKADISRRFFGGRNHWEAECLPYQVLISRPSPHWQYEFLMMNISEAGIFHPAFKTWTRRRFYLGFAHGVDEFVVEL